MPCDCEEGRDYTCGAVSSRLCLATATGARPACVCNDRRQWPKKNACSTAGIHRGVLAGEYGMLAFDIETTGLDRSRCEITCAAVCDRDTGEQRVFVFSNGDDPEDFMALLDTADRLCCFNGVRFDIPFIQEHWRVPWGRVEGWRRKTHDVFEACRLCLNHTFSLDALLEANRLPGKTGSGSNAVELWRQGRWDELAAYCLADAEQTHAVSSMEHIVIPKAGMIMCRWEGFKPAPPPCTGTA